MFRPLLLTATVSLLMLGTVFAPADAGANEPIDMRLNWRPGQTYRYANQVTAEIQVDGIAGSMHMEMKMDTLFRVLSGWHDESTRVPRHAASSAAGGGAPVRMGGRRIEVELASDEIRLSLRHGGQRLEAVIRKDNVTATMDGQPLPEHQLSEIRQDIGPAQALLSTPMRLTMTESGRFVKVSGIDGLSADEQRALAKEMLSGMQLPERPLRVGETFTDVRKLEDLFPSNAGDNRGMAGRTLEAVWKLAGVERTAAGSRVARMTTAIKTSLAGVFFAEINETVDMDFDLQGTRLYDIEAGTVSQESVQGTVTVRPRDADQRADLPQRITVKLSGVCKLIEVRSAPAGLTY